METCFASTRKLARNTTSNELTVSVTEHPQSTPTGTSTSRHQTGKKFELVAQNELGEAIAASPAISNGTIYFRTFDSLWAIRK